jgi:hypothetical protein
MGYQVRTTPRLQIKGERGTDRCYRRYGRVFQGCVGSFTQVGTFMSTEHSEMSYGGVKWIGGAVGFCSKLQNNPPLSRCEGDGTFI